MGARRGAGVLRSFKSLLDVAKALLPVLYCGGLLYYFFDVGGSIENVEAIGLGPTVLGLGAVGLLFCIPLALKILRLRRVLKSPGPGGGGTPGDHDGDDGGAAADAVIARYMARKEAEEKSARPNNTASGDFANSSAPRSTSGAPAKRGFGRKTG